MPFQVMSVISLVVCVKTDTNALFHTISGTYILDLHTLKKAAEHKYSTSRIKDTHYEHYTNMLGALS